MNEFASMLTIGTTVATVLAFFFGLRWMLVRMDERAESRENRARDRHGEMMRLLKELRDAVGRADERAEEQHQKLLNYQIRFDERLKSVQKDAQ